MFKKIFINLCNEKNISPSAACRAIGLSNAAYSSWTDDTIPRRSTLAKFADYFGVQVEDLLGDAPITQKEKLTDEVGEPTLSKKEESVMELFRQVPLEEQPAVLEALGTSLAALGKVPEDQREIVARLIVASLNK